MGESNSSPESRVPDPDQEPQNKIYVGDTVRALFLASVIGVLALVKGGCGLDQPKQEQNVVQEKNEK